MDATTVRFHFGEWLKHRRRQLDLIQAELAYHSGCSLSGLRKIDDGLRRPSRQMAELLARALEIPTENVLTFVRVARGELSIERVPNSVPAMPV